MPISAITHPLSICRRNFVITSICLGALITTECLAKPRTFQPKILFVCQAGTAKSAIAREIFKKRAKERGINVDVLSRGIVIEDHISPELRQKLIEDGIDTTSEPAMPLQPTDWEAANILVNFNPLPISVIHKDVRDWSDLPSVNVNYAHARAIMNERIDALLNEISGSAK